MNSQNKNVFCFHTMNKDEILEELNKHICGASFINVISQMCLNEIICCSETGFPDPKVVLTYDEWMLVIGLWLKNIKKEPLKEIESIEIVEEEANILYNLLDKLHYSYLNEFSSIDYSKVESLKEIIHNTINSPVLIQEAIFYGGEGAYDLQYTSFVEKKYDKDRDWILKNKGVDINKFHPFYVTIKRLLMQKMYEFREDMKNTHYETKLSISYPYIIDIKDVVSVDSDYQRILDLFSFDIEKPSEILINGIEDFNPLVEYPLIKIDDQHLFIPKCTIVANALYELPFFWIVKDDEYFRNKGSDYRGSSTETITNNLLKRIFPEDNVMKNVKIIHKKDICAEIDVLVTYADVAIIFQVKSKRLSLNSRKGDKESIAKDFEQAIGKAYEQALVSELKMMDSNSVIKNNDDDVSVSSISEIIKIGITLDFFPAIEAILRRGLGGDTPFISMSIFDLDILTRNLTAEQFIDYVKFRVHHRKELYASNEACYMGFYLKHNGFKAIDKSLRKSNHDGYNWVAISEDYACEIDKKMSHDLLCEYMPETYEMIYKELS